MKKCSLLVLVMAFWLTGFAQLDTTAILSGTWDLVQSSAGYGYLNQDSLLSVSTSFNSNHTIKFTDKHVVLKSKTMLDMLNDSIVIEEKYKRNRKGDYFLLKRKRQSSFMRIEKLNFDELVLSEQKEHTLPMLFIETKYFYKKRTHYSTKPDHCFVGKWIMADTCQGCTFWQDSLLLKADTSVGFLYGLNYYLTVKYSDAPKLNHNSFDLSKSYYPEPDTSDPYSRLYGKYSAGNVVMNRSWIFNRDQKIIYFYPEFLSDSYYAYRILSCTPGRRLVLIRVD